MAIDWYDAAQRAELIERVGPDEYNRLHEEHIARSTVARVNGYAIRQFNSRFGVLYDANGSGFPKQADAESHARTLPPGPLTEVARG